MLRIEIGKIKVPILKKLAFAVAVFPAELEVFEGIGRQFRERFSRDGDLEAAGLIPVRVFPFCVQGDRLGPLLPFEEGSTTLAIFVHDAVIDIALLESGP